MDEQEIRSIRAQFPPLETFVWFQNGGVSITPRPVADYHAELMAELRDRGPMHIAYPKEEYPRRKETIDRVARFFGAEPTQVALMRGVSEAFQTVIRGVDWKAGDQILITAEEEAAIYLASLHLRDRHGIEVVTVPITGDCDSQLAAFNEAMTDRTRLVAFSHVTTDIGARMPAKEICEATRTCGALSFVDIAHSGGLWPINLMDMGCDFAGILSYKWMYAPYASGLLFVRDPDAELIEVTYAGGRSESKLDWHTHEFAFKPGAERFQFGPWSWPLVHAWARSLDFLEGIGIDRIWARTCVLTDRLKRGVAETDGLDLHTPESSLDSAALVSFGVGENVPEAVRDGLRERHNIVIKAVYATRKGMRASCPFFLLEEEIDFLVEKLGEELE
jgi:cysteine desulfurase / selenocysteine lyase